MILQQSAASDEELAAMVQRRVSGEPLEQIVRWAEFCGLRVDVQPGDFVPDAAQKIPGPACRAAGPLHVGPSPAADGARSVLWHRAIGLALADQLPTLDLYTADIDPAAVVCARHYLEGIGRVFRSDRFRGLPSKRRGCAAIAPTGRFLGQPRRRP